MTTKYQKEWYSFFSKALHIDLKYFHVDYYKIMCLSKYPIEHELTTLQE